MKKNLVATVTLSTPKAPEAFASEIAAVILQKDTSAHYYDQLTVQIYYGYDIGIAQRWSHQEFSRTTLEWGDYSRSVPQRGSSSPAPLGLRWMPKRETKCAAWFQDVVRL